jgi:hypothetical protein
MDELAGVVAEIMARRIDLHHLGVEPRDPAACPLADALDIARSGAFSKRRIRCVAYVGVDSVACSFTGLTEDMRAALDVVLGPVLTEVPKVSGTPFYYFFPRGRIPNPKWTSVRKRVPGMMRRVDIGRGATAIAGVPFVPDLIRPVDKADMETYGQSRSVRKRIEVRRPSEVPPVVPAPHRPSPARGRADPREAPGFIDHADFVRTYDNYLFVAVMDAGLSGKDRVTINLSDGQIDIMQAGRLFGTVGGVPSTICALLQSQKTVNLVEMRRGVTTNEIKARHKAMIRDLADNSHSSTLLAWTRTRGLAAKGDTSCQG